MVTPTLAQQLARYSHRLRYEDLPPQTVHEVKRRFIDSLGCAMGAISGEPGQISRTLARTVSSTVGATVIGTTHESSPEWAAFSNGVHFRYLDYNDTYLSKEPAHPSDNIAAVLAAGEPTEAHGRELILATVLAYEIQCRLCDACSIRAGGWDHVTYGSFSASLAAGKLLGLSVEQLVHAQGLAGVEHYSEPGFAEIGLAVQPGGGVDVALIRRLAFRVQLDFRFVRAGAKSEFPARTFKEWRLGAGAAIAIGK